MGGFQGVKPQDDKGVFASLGVHQGGIKKIPTLPKIHPSLLHDVTTLVLLYTVIWLVGNAVNTQT